MTGGYKANSLMLGDVTIPVVDLEGSAKVFVPLPGRAVVEMAPWRDKQGAIYLPDVAYDPKLRRKGNPDGMYRPQGRYRPNVGVMLCAGRERDSDWPCAYRPGDVVVVRPYDGLNVLGYDSENFKTENELRFFGIAQDLEEGKSIAWDLYDSIVGWHNGGDIIPGPGYTKVRRHKLKSDLLVSTDIWLDEGTAINGTYSGVITWHETHPDDLLHLEFTDESDIWLVPDRCVQMLLE